MFITHHKTADGPRWALDNKFLPRGLTLAALLALPQASLVALLQSLPVGDGAYGELLPPLEPTQEVWGSGVTYLRSREARKAESTIGDVYQRVYEAPRPEIFFKQIGWRTVGHGQAVRIRKDTRWNVPEPELTLVINAHEEIVGYTVGNDMSSRDIEGENPLYLPQAKTYNGSCALGPGIEIAEASTLTNLTIQLQIRRNSAVAFSGETSTSNIKRPLDELVDYLYRELDFPHGAFLMTGTGIVPPDDFTLATGDVIQVTIGNHTLENKVE